jgi:hypothetical protein
MVSARRVRALVLLGLTLAGGCSLMARDHPCYPYLEHHYHGAIPKDVVGKLAHERGARRQMGNYKAPTGFYWRVRQGSLDLREMRMVLHDHELVSCPGAPIIPSPNHLAGATP